MSGDGNYAGTIYQQRVAAYIGAHVLAQVPLQWLGSEDDTPVAYSAETQGAGDDVSVVLSGSASPAFEVQAKHGLTGGTKLQAAVETIANKLRSMASTSMRVVIAVDESASRPVRLELANDLVRLRSGRADGLKSEATALLKIAHDMVNILPRISVNKVDVDADDHAHAKVAIEFLRNAIEDPAQATTAWRLLVDDAGVVCRGRLARSRKDLVELLKLNRIVVKPPAAEDHRRLDFCADLLVRWYVSAAREQLLSLQSRLSAATERDPVVQYRLLHLLGKCALLDRDCKGALEYSRRALQLKPDGPEALRVAANAELCEGNLAQASVIIEKAIAVGPFDVRSWRIRLQIEAARGIEIVCPPSTVAQSATYRAALAHVANEKEDFSQCLSITAELLKDGVRDGEVILARAHALLRNRALGQIQEIREAESYCSEVIDALGGESHHPNFRWALSLRSTARFEAGDLDGAEADSARLIELGECDPELLRSAATMKLSGGDAPGALEILQHPAVKHDSLLLAMRARLKKELGQAESARQDAAGALELLSPSMPTESRLTVAETLLALDEITACRQILEDPTVRDSSHVLRFVVLGRIAFMEGRVEDGIEAFRSAGEVEPKARTEALFELASWLSRAGKPDQAADVLAEFKGTALPEARLRALAVLLCQARRFAECQRLLDVRFTGTELPPWALSISAEIALQREDTDAAILHIRELFVQKAGSLVARIELVRLLFEMNRDAEARTEALAILHLEPLAPDLRMQTAILLAHLKCWPEALKAAYRSYREARQDPSMFEGLMIVSRNVRGEPPDVKEVGPDTFVRLKRAEQIREYLVISEGPVDPTRGELDLGKAAALGLIGKRVGETVAMGAVIGTDDWLVDEILAAHHRGIQEAYANYEKFFPERSFVRSFQVPDGQSVADVLPIVQSVQRRKEREQQIVGLGRQKGWPLGLMAGLLGYSIPTLMSRLTNGDESTGITAEWPQPARQSESVKVASAARQIVLTRSALAWAAATHLLERLAKNYVVIAPKSLLRSLNEEVREAESAVATGRATVGTGPAGLSLRSLPAGHDSLVAQHADLVAMLSWCSAHVKFEPRPLEWLTSTRDDETCREMFGRDSWDALELAHYRRIPLYADDLGLRRLEHNGESVRSFSTATLILALAARSEITAGERNHRLHDLALGLYSFMPVDADFFYSATMRSGELNPGQLLRVFGALGGLPTIGEAAAVAAKTFKMVATSQLQVLPLSGVVNVALQGMSGAWSAPLIAQCVREAAFEELRLMPQVCRAIDQACLSFAKANSRPPIVNPGQ